MTAFTRQLTTRLPLTALCVTIVMVVSGCASNRTVARPCINDLSLGCDGHEEDIGAVAAAIPHSISRVELTDGDKPDKIASAKSSTAPLTLTLVASHTSLNNPDIGIARAQAFDTAAGVNIASVPYTPKVEFTLTAGPEATYNFESTIRTQETRKEATLRASQLLFDFGKTGAEIDWAKALNEAAIWREHARTDEVLLEVVEAYLAVLEFDLQIANSLKNEHAHKELHRIMALNEEAGNATVADVQKALGRLENARTVTLNLRSDRQNSASNFKRLTGLHPEALRKPKAVNSRLTSLQTSNIDTYAQKDAKLLSLKWDLVGLEAQKASLLRDYLPKLTLDATAKVQENVTGTNPVQANGRVTVSLSGVIFDGGERKFKGEQLDARIDEVRYRYRRATDQMEQEIRDSARILQTAKQKRASIADRIKSGTEVVKLYIQQYEAGQRSMFEVLDAQQELFAAKSEQITGDFDVMRASYRAVKLNGHLVKTLVAQAN